MEANLKELSKEIHKPALKNFPRRNVYASKPNELWYAWSFPLKNKAGLSILHAFEKIPVTPLYLWVDEGYNRKKLEYAGQ